MSRRIWMVMMLGTLTAAAGVANGEFFGPETYWEQVRAANADYAAAQAGVRAARKALAERNLLTSPFAFAEGQFATDKSQSIEPMYYGDERRQNQLSIGLEEQTALGLNWRLVHQTVHTAVEGASPIFLTEDSYYTSKTGVELSQDFWRNLFGQEVRATADALEAKNRATLYEREYQIRQMTVQAEVVYWKLALAQEVVRIQRELLDRALRLQAWVEDRVGLKLQDRSDLLQAQAQVQFRELELAAAQDQERMAARAFNALRGQNSERIAETLPLPLEAQLKGPELPKAAPARGDLQALEWSRQAAARDASRRQENLRPELQARAAYYFNGLDRDFSPAWNESTQTRYASYAVGFLFRAPLDWFTRADLSESYGQEAQATAEAVKQKRLGVETEWQELRRRLQENQSRWIIAKKLEDIQKQKADYERQRLRRGNSLTFQVLQFEQDWGQSRLARVGVESIVLELLAQIKLYGE